MAKNIKDETLMDIYDTLDDVWTDLEHLKSRIYDEGNKPNVVDTYSNRIYGLQQHVEIFKALVIVHIEEF